MVVFSKFTKGTHRSGTSLYYRFSTGEALVSRSSGRPIADLFPFVFVKTVQNNLKFLKKSGGFAPGPPIFFNGLASLAQIIILALARLNAFKSDTKNVFQYNLTWELKK